MRSLLIALALILTLPPTTFADVDCSDVKSKNRDECVEAKRNRNNNDFDKDDVDCSNADDPQVRRQCRQRKRD